MNEKNEITKPLSVRRDEYIKNVLDLTNSSGLPIFVVEYILRDLLVEVRNVCNQQTEFEKANYQKQLEMLNAVKNESAIVGDSSGQ